MLEDYIDMLVTELAVTPAKILYLTPVFMYMIYASFYDSWTLTIPNRLNYCMMWLRLLIMPAFAVDLKNAFGFMIGGALILIPAMIILKPMGGDIKFAAALGLWAGDVSILVTMVFALISFVIYAGVIKKVNMKKSIAFSPFISLSYMIVLFIGMGLSCFGGNFIL